jgi:hypothetical protein
MEYHQGSCCFATHTCCVTESVSNAGGRTVPEDIHFAPSGRLGFEPQLMLAAVADHPAVRLRFAQRKVVQRALLTARQATLFGSSLRLVLWLLGCWLCTSD